MILEFVEEIKNKINYIEVNINGIYMCCRIYFVGKWMKYGVIYFMWMLRLWCKDYGKCEN